MEGEDIGLELYAGDVAHRACWSRALDVPLEIREA